MLRILVCSEFDLRRELLATIIGRQAIELYRAERFQDTRLLTATLDPRLIFIDRDLPKAREFIERLRQDPATRQRSLAVLARGAFEPIELELVETGANGIFRLPPDAGWDERISRLLAVPVRHDARLMVRLAVATEPETAGAVLNLSSGGMRLATQNELHVHDEIGFSFRLPDGSAVAGRGRIVREAAPTEYGVEFVDLDPNGREAIRQFQRSARLG